MGVLDLGCYECGKDCVDVEFCSDGAQLLGDGARDGSIKLPRSLKVTIHANPDYWGFGGILTSGYLELNQGHYDYFEGFDEDHIGFSLCNDNTLKISKNETRPDVAYRSVYDPDTGQITNYDGVIVEGSGRGGAISYLINREPGQVGAGGTVDFGTCPEIDPTKSFKRFPENFGWANKIHFDTSLYKNLTSAWRMIDYEACYDSEQVVKYDSQVQLDASASNVDYSPRAGHLITCLTSGDGTVFVNTPKQNFQAGSEHVGKFFDPARVTVTGLNALDGLNYNEISGIYGQTCTPKQCLPDGSVAGEYAGNFMNHKTGIYVNSDGDTQAYALYGGTFIRESGGYCHQIAGMHGSGTILTTLLQYTDWSNTGQLSAATGLRAGQTLMLNIDRAHTGLIENWDYENGINTPCQPSFSDGSNTGQMDWLKDANGNVQNLCGLFTIAGVKHYPTGQPFTASNGDYIADFDPYSLVCLAGTWGPEPNNPDKSPGENRIWVSGSDGQWTAANTYDQNTCCGLNALGVDDRFKDLNCDTVYHSDFRRVFNDSTFKIQSNRAPEYRETYDYGTVTPHSNVNGPRKDKSYIGVDAFGSPSGTIEDNGYTSFFPKELPYYGPFNKTDTCDNIKRGEVKLNTTKNKNATCFTKQSTLEVYPDCYTQYHQYQDCEDGELRYKINRVPRLSFVYRGCDYHDSCTFDESGRPYAEPTTIQDLRRGRGGEEIHMFLNLGNAWASTIAECSCDGGGGTEAGLIYHVDVNSPVTFPSFPDFDLRPTEYGCDDQTFQLAQYLRYAIGSADAGGSPDPTSLSGNFCSDVPGLPAACNVRQPYTTYGYIMNLCGKEEMSRRGVVEAFNNLHQSGTCNHLNSVTGCSGLVEPFYRGFEIPAPSPYSTGDFWQVSGLLLEDVILEKTGEVAGYWGLRDTNGALIAPYYQTRSGVFTCPGAGSPSEQGFIDFSDSGNYIDGWPTGNVPFLVQIEAETRCVGCTTSMMETGNLTLNIESLPTSFLHAINHPTDVDGVGHMYGYQHCNYGGFALDTTDTFGCSSGFRENQCLGSYTGYNSIETIVGIGNGTDGDGNSIDNGDKFFQTYGVPHSGETCPLLDNKSITLNSRRLGSSDYGKGWQTGSSGNPYVKIVTALGNSFINQQPAGFRLQRDGYSLYAKFGLGCSDMNVGGEGSEIDLTMPLRMNQAYRDIGTTDAVRVSFGGQGCPGHYPTKLSDEQNSAGEVDLNLVGKLWAVAPEFESLFESLDFNQFKVHAEDSDNIVDGGRIVDLGMSNGMPTLYNIFGLCIGDKIYKHGCFLTDGDPGVTLGSNGGTYTISGVQGMFFGVSGAQCAGLNLCNTCEKTDWPNSSYPDGNVICDPDCAAESDGGYLGMGTGNLDGSPNSAEWNVKPPINYEFNNCFCLCKDPTPFAEFEVTGFNGESILTDAGTSLYPGLGVSAPTAYWYSMSRASTNQNGVVTSGVHFSGLGPFLADLTQPNNPYPAFSLGTVTPEDWFTYSHGVNKEVTGIQHDLVRPRLVTNDSSPGEGCNTLGVKTCATGYDQFGTPHDGCAVDPTNRVNSANCLEPVHNAGWNDFKVKTNVTVNKKACFPETMIVNKVECKEYFGQYPYFDLVVSREYYSHDRTWRRVRDLGDSNGCAKSMVGAYFYPAASGCTGCTPIPYAVPTDLVTPVYEAPCAVHPSTGAHVSQDFQYEAVNASNTGTIQITCQGVCKYQWFGSWNFDAGASTCSCNCSPPSSPGSTMGEIGYGTCS